MVCQRGGGTTALQHSQQPRSHSLEQDHVRIHAAPAGAHLHADAPSLREVMGKRKGANAGQREGSV
jgi:hypothetical protein